MKKSKAVQRLGLGLMLAAALFAAPACSAQQTNQTDSSTAATDAYEAMVSSGRGLRQRGMGRRDLRVSRRAGAVSQSAASRPDWEPEIVQYRISYCANQIEKIGRTTGQSASELVKPDAGFAVRWHGIPRTIFHTPAGEPVSPSAHGRNGTRNRRGRGSGPHHQRSK